MKQYHSTLSELIADLRHQAKLSHDKVGLATYRTRWTSQHYEDARARPPIGYVAFIARAAHAQSSRARDPHQVAQELLDQINAAITLFYGPDDTIASWEELCDLADRWVAEGWAKQQKRCGVSGDASAPAASDTRAQDVDSHEPACAAPHWQLRAAMPDFVGREAEHGRLVAALRGAAAGRPQSAVACVRGLGGAGKTELAYRVAEELVDSFPDGQLFLGLAGSGPSPLRPEDALVQLVQSLAPHERLPEGLDALRAAYRTALRNRRVLIVVDDVRDANQLRDLLPPAGSALLITTRWRFALDGLVDANVVELGGLAPDEAARLVQTLCPRVGAVVPELTELCGYLPLALRIAAGRLGSDSTMRVGSYLAQLRDERSRLAALEGDEAERTISAVLGLSYRTLEPLGQSMLAQLSVFPASFSRDAIPGVVDLYTIEGEVALLLDRTLSQLHRASLLDVDAAGERVWLHSLVRAFAAAQLDDREAAQRRFAATYGVFLHRLSSMAIGSREALVAALALFDAERHNVDQGVRWTLQHAAEPEYADILIDYVVGASALGHVRLHPAEILRPLYVAALALGRRLDHLPMQAIMLNNLGVLEGRLGNRTGARQFHEEASALAATDATSVLLPVQLNTAHSQRALGKLDSARAAAEAVRQHCAATSDRLGELRALLELGAIERWSDRPERAVQYAETALELARQLGATLLEHRALCNAANAISALPTTEVTHDELHLRAAGYALEAVAIADRLNDSVGRADARTVLGNVETCLGDPRAAVMYQHEALAIAREAGHQQIAAAILVNLGDAYRELREGELAAAAYADGVRAYEALSDRYGLARAYWRYGALILRLHEFGGTAPSVDEVGDAAALWEQAVAIERAGQMPQAEAHAETLSQLQRWLAAHPEAGGDGAR